MILFGFLATRQTKLVPNPLQSVAEMLIKAGKGELEDTHFLDLQKQIVDRELNREAEIRKSGPIAENILHDKGIASAAKFG